MPDRATASAPGRVNLIGEHTDYHDGLVLPMVIPQRTTVRVQRRDDARVVVTSRERDPREATFVAGQESRGQGWLDYVQAVTRTLRERGVSVPGVDITITSDVPVGAGVSSSAALLVALLRAMRTLLVVEYDDVEVARLARTAEVDFVGVPVGIMDQMACSLGRDGAALFLDTSTLTFEHLPLPAASEVVVIDSGVTHAHAGGGYRVRRRETFEAARALGVARLRELSTHDLGRVAGLPAPLGRRARHVVTENARVLAAVDAMRTGDAVVLGRLFAESHASMRDDFEISTPEVDALVDLATAHPAVFGARLTGGGFGGAVVALARAGMGSQVADEVCAQYEEEVGRRPTTLLPTRP